LVAPGSSTGAAARPTALDERLQAVVDGVTGDVFVGLGLDGKPQAFYVPGASLSVGLPGQATRTYEAGWANLRRRTPMRADQAQPIGSGTKPMTAALVLRLVTRGRLRLGDRLGAVAATHRRDGGRLAALARRFRLRLRGVTIRELLAMTSGLRDFDDDPAYVRAFARAPGDPLTLRRLATLGLARPRLFAPGASGHTYYSNTNYVLLAMVVHAITGRPYGVQLERLFRRAGMRHTTYPRRASSTPAGGPVHGYAPPLHAGGSGLLRNYWRAFAEAPSVRTRIVPEAVQAVSSNPLARGPTVAVGPASAGEQGRYGGPASVLRQDLTGAYSLLGAGASAGAIVSTSGDLARFWRALFSGRLLGERGLRLIRRSVPAPPNPLGVRNYYTLGLARQDVAAGAFWPGSPRLRIWMKLGDIWGYTSASYYVQGPPPYDGVVVTNTTNLFPSPVGDLGVLRETLRALASDDFG
jgi:CubicO group peptidase (beta-lactamase class C family)